MNGGLLLRYYHTIRHLRPVQVYGRLLYDWRRPKLDMGPTPTRRPVSGTWVSPTPKPVRQRGPVQFRFLNREGVCATPEDWNAPRQEKLWLYNLHYFDDLAATGSSERVDWHRALLRRWIAENPPARGTGWEAYPTSLRIVNWVKWALARHSVPEGFDRSLALQARWLMTRVERHLLANHLFANAKALVIAGSFFQGAEADSWRRTGLSILAVEIPIQILKDGGHFERSPMYHALILEDILDLINATETYRSLVDDAARAEWRTAAGRMLAWGHTMSHPDGEIAFFNDAAFDIAPPIVALAGYAKRLGIAMPSTRSVLAESGYVRAEAGPAVLIADVAPVGPDYQPAHAHADTLSFELSLFGQRALVNSGTSTYARGAQRASERSTAAHNTVEIDGTDSSEVWSAFRVARRARPRDVMVQLHDHSARIAGAHDGYRRLPGKPVHHRDWRLQDGGLTIVDRINGDFRSAVARFHLHPSVAVDGSTRHLTLPGGERVRWTAQGGRERIENTFWHPEFGVDQGTSCLCIDFTGRDLVFALEWPVP